MNLREALQTELWSKRTTRRILVAIGVLGIGAGLWWAIELFWMTPWEHKAAREALVQIDKLQHFELLSDSQYATLKDQAQEKIDSAQKVAWTSRDKDVAVAVFAYFLLIDIDHDALKGKKELWKEHPELAAKFADSDIDRETTGKKSTILAGLRLHQVLD